MKLSLALAALSATVAPFAAADCLADCITGNVNTTEAVSKCNLTGGSLDPMSLLSVDDSTKQCLCKEIGDKKGNLTDCLGKCPGGAFATGFLDGCKDTSSSDKDDAASMALPSLLFIGGAFATALML